MTGRKSTRVGGRTTRERGIGPRKKYQNYKRKGTEARRVVMFQEVDHRLVLVQGGGLSGLFPPLAV